MVEPHLLLNNRQRTRLKPGAENHQEAGIQRGTVSRMLSSRGR